MKKEINAFDYAAEIVKALPQGVLLTSEAEDCVYAMTIGWGTIGIEWGKPIFTVYVREGRFSRELIDRTGEFTVCIPYGKVNAANIARVVGICGSCTGRDTDKFSQAKLTLVEADEVRPPAVKEFPLTLECRVVFRQVQPVANISPAFSGFYPENTDSANTGVNSDPHIAYYGEIVKAYVIED